MKRSLFVLAAAFAAATLLYNGLWLASQNPSRPEVELGFNATYRPAERLLAITEVFPGSPAERAGVRPGDDISAIDGRRLESATSQPDAWNLKRPGDSVRLTVERPGQAEPVTLTAVFRRRVLPAGDVVASRVLTLYPVPFVVVGLAVLLLRVEDRNAWLLALLLAGFTAIPDLPGSFATLPPALHAFLAGYRAVSLGLLGGFFYWFFAVFPARSVFDERLPWLKWVALALGLGLALPGLAAGSLRTPGLVAALIGERASVAIMAWYPFPLLALGLISLAANYRRTRDPEARRKVRVIVWGTAVGVTPALLYASIQTGWSVPASQWLSAILDVALLSLFPLSFAYAVVKHRVLEIPVLLRRSARYLLVQRGFTILLALASLALMLLFGLWFTRYLQPLVEFAQPSGIALGAAFGTALMFGGTRVHRQVSGRIDRAFFRRAYDARVILEDLAERARTVTDRAELAHLLEQHLGEALQPSTLAIYLRDRDEHLRVALGDVPPGLEALSTTEPVLVELTRRGQPAEMPRPTAEGVEPSALEGLNADCLTPMLGRDGRLVGLVVLGPRRSDEPYSREDTRLLASVAGQASTALENIALAGEIAERMARERQAAHEMAIAKEVQSRLLPPPPTNLRTIDCAAECVQAHSVGGDGYDFLDLGDGRVGLVLADVSGKGVYAALLMANLQAYLRSLSGMTPHDLARVLREVNRLMWNSTGGKQYATVFFGVYDEGTRRLQYANCGHNPPIRLGRDDAVDRLGATGTVIGLFDRWNGSVAQIDLEPGDVLVVFSDGVTDALSGDEEFGEERLLAELRAHRHLPVAGLVAAVLSTVLRFSGSAQWDDLTLLAARVKS